MGELIAILQLELRRHVYSHRCYWHQLPIKTVQRLLPISSSKRVSDVTSSVAKSSSSLLSSHRFSSVFRLVCFRLDFDFHGTQYADNYTKNLLRIPVRLFKAFNYLKLLFTLQPNSLQRVERGLLLVLHNIPHFSNLLRFILLCVCQ